MPSAELLVKHELEFAWSMSPNAQCTSRQLAALALLCALQDLHLSMTGRQRLPDGRKFRVKRGSATSCSMDCNIA